MSQDTKLIELGDSLEMEGHSVVALMVNFRSPWVQSYLKA